MWLTASAVVMLTSSLPNTDATVLAPTDSAGYQDREIAIIRVIDERGCAKPTDAQEHRARSVLEAASQGFAERDDAHAAARGVGLEIVLDLSPSVAADPAFAAAIGRAIAR
ncbi:MAG: hypothetical protein AAFN41_10635, partial [Planctomycetota bacterium]